MALTPVGGKAMNDTGANGLSEVVTPYQLVSFVTATIADTATKTEAIDLGNTTICGVFIPAGFEGVALSFEASADGATFVEVQDGAGAAVAKVVAAGKYVRLDAADFAGIRWLKLVADAQTGAAILTLAVRAV